MSRRSILPCALVLALGLLGLAGPAWRARAEATDSAKVLAQVSEAWWQHQLEENLALRVKRGLKMERLPAPSEERARREAAFAEATLKRLASIRPQDLSHDEWLTLKILSWEAQATIDQARFYWFGFAVTPYSARGLLRDPAPPLKSVHDGLRAYPLAQEADLAAYLALLEQYPTYVAAQEARLRGQAERGILIPVDEVDQVLPLLRSLARPPAESLFRVSEDRLQAFDGARRSSFQNAVADVIAATVNPALEHLVGFVAGEYGKKAPVTVGVGQYPGGKDYYRNLVRLHTTLDLPPEEIHRIGVEEVARLRSRMRAVRDAVGFRGAAEEFHRRLRSDPRFFARTPEEVGVRLLSYVEAIRPRIDQFFETVPRAPYGVKRLDPALEGSMTYGYYQVPAPTDPKGYYLYNGSDLEHRSLLNAGALIYHELIPGHHFQLNLQAENNGLPAWRRESVHTAFIEGWGLYSSLLASEMGLYRDPYDEYGMLAMDVFLSSRLVVDTGMNYFGWPRARAVAFMKENTLESDEQIRTETLRYSADMPGQALAYKIGARKILDLRQGAKRALGPRFEIKQFHEAVLGAGSMPLSVLQEQVQWFVRQHQPTSGANTRRPGAADGGNR